MLQSWIISKLEPVKECNRVLVRDSLQLLGEGDGTIHRFACENGYTVVKAATNLAFRDLYDQVCADPEIAKVLVIDRAPARRRAASSVTKAPPPFYPDLLALTSPECRIDLDLRQFLKEATGDDNWPAETNDPRYARLIVRNLEAVQRAHKNLRAANPTRFEDHDFRTIVAFAALGVAESAFKKPNAEDYWKIGLLSYEALEELETLTPEITKPIREELRKAPAPFCHFANHSADLVVRAFYLSVVLSQHSENWNLLLANIDPDLKPLSDIKPDILKDAAIRLVGLDRDQAHHDLTNVEKALSKENLQFLLLDQLKLDQAAGFAAALERERYSTTVASLALLMALNNLVSATPAKPEQQRIMQALFPEDGKKTTRFIDIRPGSTFNQLKEAYQLADQCNRLRDQLALAMKNLKVTKPEDLSYKHFREIWNDQKINRLEYYLSALQRLAQTGNLLIRHEDELPSLFSNTLAALQQRLKAIKEEVNRQLDDMNARFQELVAREYPNWAKEIGKDGSKADGLPLFASQMPPILTSQFLRRCLKPYWDFQKEKAVLLVFDGMRYDIWDELLRPLFEDRMDIIADLPASSLLPSETHITRKAIFAGTFPESFDTHAAENVLLKEGLAREFGYAGEVEVVSPDTAGTGETVRYRAGNLDVYIFELCDKELHKIAMKTLPDGRQVPSRPLSFVYEQHLKNIVDTEVMAIIRNLVPATKVIVTADHGFGQVGREPLWFSNECLNEPTDCSYLNCWLRVPISDSEIPGKVRNSVVAFTPEQLRMPAKEVRFNKKLGHDVHKEFKAVVFPKTGFSFSRQGSPYHPDAYTHGGISIQELMIPMVVLKVKKHEEGLLILDNITGPQEVVEGEEVEFHLPISKSTHLAAKEKEIRADVDATWSCDPGERPLPHQVLYVSAQGGEAIIRFKPDPSDATVEERKNGLMERTLTVTVSYREGYRISRKMQSRKFAVRLNSEQIVRRIPPSLGNILGLTPKSMR
ncbi:MAG TPA: PglZ domain-containing protein [Syntrophales bacterium]|nr:PglZ domain-containing protein [Syntrophales bacterium]